MYTERNRTKEWSLRHPSFKKSHCEHEKPLTSTRWHLLGFKKDSNHLHNNLERDFCCKLLHSSYWLTCIKRGSPWAKWLLHFCKFLIKPSFNLEPDYFFGEPMNRRFQWYMVCMEMLSPFHTSRIHFECNVEITACKVDRPARQPKCWWSSWGVPYPVSIFWQMIPKL